MQQWIKMCPKVKRLNSTFCKWMVFQAESSNSLIIGMNYLTKWIETIRCLEKLWNIRFLEQRMMIINTLYPLIVVPFSIQKENVWTLTPIMNKRIQKLHNWPYLTRDIYNLRLIYHMTHTFYSASTYIL